MIKFFYHKLDLLNDLNFGTSIPTSLFFMGPVLFLLTYVQYSFGPLGLWAQPQTIILQTKIIHQKK